MFVELPNIRNLSQFIHLSLCHIYTDYQTFFRKKSKLKFAPTGTCSPFSRKIFITAKGKVLPCENIPHKYAMGCVDTEVNINTLNLAKKINEYYSSITRMCSVCYNAAHCLQCIYLLDDLENKPICKGFLDENGYMKKIAWFLEEFEKEPIKYSRIVKELTII